MPKLFLRRPQASSAAANARNDTRQFDAQIVVELVEVGEGKQPDAAAAITLSDRLKDKGFLVSYSGKYDNVLKIRPPLAFSHQNADDFLVAFDACMEEM